MQRRLRVPYVFISVLLLSTIFLAACGSSTTTTTTSTAKTVSLVTDIGGLNDRGYNQLSDQGYLQAVSKYKFAVDVIQTTSEADYVKNLTRAAQSSQLVIGVGFLMASAVTQVAKEYPSVDFALIDSCAEDTSGNCVTLKNVAPLYFKEQEAGCLVGAAAGQMQLDGKSQISKLNSDNTISAVGGLKIPPVDRYIAGYRYCAQKVDPSIKVLITYAQSFDDTAKCEDAANSQISQGSDIVFQVAGGCGLGALQAADQKGVYGIGVDSDQSTVNKSVATSAVKKVNVAVYQTIVNFESGKYTNNPPDFDLQSGGVGYGVFAASLPADVKAAADKYATEIKASQITLPATV